MPRTCARCHAPLSPRARVDARWCGGTCRVAAHRALRAGLDPVLAVANTDVPAVLLTDARWVRWTLAPRGGRLTKVPLTTAGRAASSTDATTWSSYAEVTASGVGVGIGVVLTGDGVTCIDLDHALVDGVPTPAAREILARFPACWAEVSPSGDGLHLWGRSSLRAGRMVRTISGQAVEVYPNGRYMTVTGDRWAGSGLELPELDEAIAWLLNLA